MVVEVILLAMADIVSVEAAVVVKGVGRRGDAFDVFKPLYTHLQHPSLSEPERPTNPDSEDVKLPRPINQSVNHKVRRYKARPG